MARKKATPHRSGVCKGATERSEALGTVLPTSRVSTNTYLVCSWTRTTLKGTRGRRLYNYYYYNSRSRNQQPEWLLVSPRPPAAASPLRSQDKLAFLPAAKPLLQLRCLLGVLEQTNPNLLPIGDRFGFVFIYEYFIVKQPAFSWLLFNIWNINSKKRQGALMLWKLLFFTENYKVANLHRNYSVWYN